MAKSRILPSEYTNETGAKMILIATRSSCRMPSYSKYWTPSAEPANYTRRKPPTVWMARPGVTHEQLERDVPDEARAARLRDRVTARRVEEYFEAHRADFESACLARFEVGDEPSAHRTCEAIRSGVMDFFQAAQERFLAAADRAERPAGELFVAVRRGETPADLAMAVFAASPGDIVGPVRTDRGYSIIRVLATAPARLDDATRSAIKRILFEAWLAERRQTATVDWYWGKASQTAQVV